jgi:hypothetical protein
MTVFASIAQLTPTVAAEPATTETFARVLVWVAVPAAILGATVAGAIKRAVLASPRFLEHRPGVRTFVWVGLADLVVWAVLWPALLAVRLQGVGPRRGLWVLALLMVVSLGYIANRYGFHKALHPDVAGGVRGTLVAELFTVLMPLLSVVFALVLLFFALRLRGVG